MSQDRAQSNVQWDQADDALTATQANDAKIFANLNGDFQVFVHTYSSDVEVKQRVPARVDGDGNAVAATTWETVKTLTEVGSDIVSMTSNFEYRFETATAGSVVYIDVQWGAVQ